jgi:methylmalonyl-CoA mutase
MEVAKFRALRQLWSHAAGSLGVKSEDRRIHLHVRTSALTKTACDVHTNILRATTEALSAVVGGCDGLHVGAFDAAHGAPGELARRIAQNTHAILAEECDLTRVIDPAGGSYYVEWLTDQVARRAWSLFQEIEKSGGMTQALGAGIPQSWVAESARAQADAVARRRTVVIGANQYPNPADTFAPEPAAHDVHRTRTREMAAFRRTAAAEANPLLLERMAILLETRAGSVVASAAMSGALHGATLGGICRALRHYDKEPAQVRAVAAQRLGEPFEKLRLASANWTKAHGAPPVLFQANLGPLAAYRVRAEWTTAFFAVGGFKVVHDQEFAEPAAAAEAALKSGARAVVITADDATYPNVVAPLAQLLKSRDPAIAVVVAGAPGENADAWRTAGVDAFVHRACNALELLTDLLTRAGVLS